MEEQDRFREARETMVRRQIEERGIHNPRLLEALRRIPREKFIPPDMEDRAYADAPVPIGQGQTISQPYMVAVMTDLLILNGDETVLEIGTGSGYQAAVLASLASQVHTIERNAGLAQQAAARLEEMGFKNISVHIGDGSLGWPPAAPYQAILVTAGAPEVPRPLMEQLDDDGRLVLPVGSLREQRLERWVKRGGQFNRQVIFPVSFVPLRGYFGWKDDYWD